MGQKKLQEEPLFASSMMVHFRSRFTAVHHELINSRIIEAATCAEQKAKDPNQDEGNDEDNSPPPNSGKLLEDATCTPADIKYPTDLGLLNEAREKTEAMVEQFHSQIGRSCDTPTKKPRTYRQKTRKRYLNVAKQKEPGAKEFRKGDCLKILGNEPKRYRFGYKGVECSRKRELLALFSLGRVDK